MSEVHGDGTSVADERNLQKVAVFDFDGTSIDGQSGTLFTRYLLVHGLISKWDVAKLIWWGARYTLHLPHRQDEARELVFSDLGQRSPAEVERIMRDFHDSDLISRYRPAAIAEVAKRKKEGCVTLLVSATFRGIADVAGDYLGVDGVVATVMERDANGHFTGNVKGDVVEGAAKPRAVDRWADERLGPGTWRLAYAYGDHHSDEELLAEADEGFAVCPGETLRRIAKKNGWTILDWDKCPPVNAMERNDRGDL